MVSKTLDSVDLRCAAPRIRYFAFSWISTARYITPRLTNWVREVDTWASLEDYST